MTRGQSQPGVKSHRKGRRRRVVQRKLPVAPWIVISTVITLVASGLVAGYFMLLGVGCSGEPYRATVVVAPSIQSTMSTLAHQWESTEPALDGNCIGVDIVKKPSAEVASRLGGSWNPDVDGPLPHVWIPESTAWLQMAKLTERGPSLLPAKTPYIATSPTVIAMPQPMAEALGWQVGGERAAGEPSWANLVTLAGESDWSDFGQDWGDITVGISNPKDSTPGLHALLSLVDDNQNGLVDSDELNNVAALRSAVTESASSVDDLLDQMAQADSDGDALGFVSAFPALERDVWRYNEQMNTGTKLTPVYPADGSTDAEHPLAIIQDGAGWTSATFQEIGRRFGEYLTGDEAQEILQNDGYRDGTHRSNNGTLAQADGMVPQIAEPQRTLVQPQTVFQTLTTWQALDQQSNILVVLDTSESMSVQESLGGETKPRLRVIGDELKRTIDLLGSNTSLGVWQYATGLDYVTGDDYLELLPIGELDKTHREQARSSLDQMYAEGDSALFDTAVAAYQKVLDNYNDAPGAVNMVLLISDGGNVDPAGGLSLEDMRSQLEGMRMSDRDKSVSLMTIGYGPDADAEELTEVARAGGGRYTSAEFADQINAAVLNALFYAD